MPEIVYEDNHLIVAVKPPNLLTQGDATGDDCLLDQLKLYIKERYHKPGDVYLGLVHRLDRPVGGLVAFARTSKAASRLSEQLRTHAMAREYLAVAEGGASMPDAGELHDWLVQDEETGRVRTASPDIGLIAHMDTSPDAPGAKEARLSFRVLGRDAALDTALVHVRLQTGRKHQIRVQLAHSGHPLVADMRYGRGVRGQPVALWGAVLRLTHPTRKEPMTFLSAPRGDVFLPYAATISGFINDQRKGADL